MKGRIKKTIDKWSSSPALRNVSLLATGTLVAQVINVGTTPILTRLFSTSDFAYLALFNAIATIILAIATLRFPVAIIRSQDYAEKLGLMKLTLISAGLISVISISFLWLVDVFGIFTMNTQLLLVFLAALWFYVIFSSMNQMLLAMLNSKDAYRPMAQYRIVIALMTFIISLLMYFVNHSIALIIAFSGGSFFAFLHLLKFSRTDLKAALQSKTKRLNIFARRNIDFVKYATPAALIDVLAMNAVVIFTSIYFTENETGSFFMAEKMILLPVTLVAAAVGQVFYKNMSTKYANGNLKRSDFLNLWKTLFLIGIIPTILLFFFGQQIFGFFLGENWVLAGQMAAIMAFRSLAGFMSSPTSSGFVIIEQQQYILFFVSIKFIYTAVLLYISWRMQNFMFFIYAYTIAEVVKAIITNGLMLAKVEQQ